MYVNKTGYSYFIARLAQYVASNNNLLLYESAVYLVLIQYFIKILLFTQTMVNSPTDSNHLSHLANYVARDRIIKLNCLMGCLFRANEKNYKNIINKFRL